MEEHLHPARRLVILLVGQRMQKQIAVKGNHEEFSKDHAGEFKLQEGEMMKSVGHWPGFGVILIYTFRRGALATALRRITKTRLGE